MLACATASDFRRDGFRHPQPATAPQIEDLARGSALDETEVTEAALAQAATGETEYRARSRPLADRRWAGTRWSDDRLRAAGPAAALARGMRRLGLGGYLAAILAGQPWLGVSGAALGLGRGIGALRVCPAGLSLLWSLRIGAAARPSSTWSSRAFGRAQAAAGSGSGARHSDRSAHAGRRAGPPAGSPTTCGGRSSGWRCITCPAPAARCIMRCCPTARTPPPRPTPQDAPLIAAATPASPRLNAAYPSADGDRFLSAAPPPPVEPGRRRLDGVGAQARQACRTEPPAARGAPTPAFCLGSAARCPQDVRYVITLDADTRLLRDTVRRMVGKMAHPLNRARFDPRPAAGDGRLWHPAAPRHRRRCRSAGRIALPARLLQPRRDRALCGGDLGRLSGPVRRRLLHRQGHLRRRCLRGGAGRAGCPRTRCSAMTCSKASLRARRSPRTSRWSRIFRPATTWHARRQHRWARGDWQLAALDRRAAAADRGGFPRVGRWKMIDNLRRSLLAPLALAALFAGWLLPWPHGLGVDGLRPGAAGAAASALAALRHPARPGGRHVAQPSCGARSRCTDGRWHRSALALMLAGRYGLARCWTPSCGPAGGWPCRAATCWNG